MARYGNVHVCGCVLDLPWTQTMSISGCHFEHEHRIAWTTKECDCRHRLNCASTWIFIFFFGKHLRSWLFHAICVDDGWRICVHVFRLHPSTSTAPTWNFPYNSTAKLACLVLCNGLNDFASSKIEKAEPFCIAVWFINHDNRWRKAAKHHWARLHFIFYASSRCHWFSAINNGILRRSVNDTIIRIITIICCMQRFNWTLLQ